MLEERGHQLTNGTRENRTEAGAERSMRRGRPRHPDVLAPRQWEVLRLVREGLSNEEIARRLGISTDGAKFHVSEILSKLGVTSRGEAARWDEDHERQTMRPSARL